MANAKTKAIKKAKVSKRVSEMGKEIDAKTKKYGGERNEAHPYSKF